MPTTADASARSPMAALREALVASAGAEKTLSMASLRGLLTGTDKRMLAAVLAQVVTDGIRLPDQVVRQFGLRAAAVAPEVAPPRSVPAPVRLPAAEQAPAPGSAPTSAPVAAPAVVPASVPAPVPVSDPVPDPVSGSRSGPDAAPPAVRVAVPPPARPGFAVDLPPGSALDFAAMRVTTLVPGPVGSVGRGAPGEQVGTTGTVGAGAPVDSAGPIRAAPGHAAPAAPAPASPVPSGFSAPSVTAASREAASPRPGSPRPGSPRPGSPDSASGRPASARPAASPAPGARVAGRVAAAVGSEASGEHGQAVHDPVKQYLKEVGRFPLLSAQREGELARRIEAGVFARERLDRAGRSAAPRLKRELARISADGEAAFTEFFEGNLRLVVGIAKKFTGRGVLFLDLIQEGNLGLVRALYKFDHATGYRFSTYATQWIRQAMHRAIADQSRTIRLPVHAHEAVTALQRAARDLGLGSPGDDLPAVAARADVSLSEARTHLSRVRRTVSLEVLAEALDDELLHSAFDPTVPLVREEPYLYGLTAEEVHSVLGTLSDRTRHIIERRYGFTGDPATLDEIGKDLGVTRERIRQILTQTEPLLESSFRTLVGSAGHPAPPPRGEGQQDAGRKTST
ncbi:sigma-70 family RNA polymerase sigma factor [Streptomyces sp. SP18CS02]|uniref:sigma-70 family RNA polymerase sigma factor n=1 Tax=Streptomyces sp. SP18CS02 TaxID=3002531 RepID=UPI002E7A6A25|nr:sigma-70 family RNA polymerase sigma factor [Streptomyces sp. SP18CS02]MEE1752982.1 sigma-70 family RNA polymerase sigma factor [Streptomyces sp. SP18CS02]